MIKECQHIGFGLATQYLVLRKATFILADQTVYRIKNSTCVFIFSCYLIIFYSL